MVDEEIAMVLPEYIGWKDLVYQVVLIQKVHGFLDASVLLSVISFHLLIKFNQTG